MLHIPLIVNIFISIGTYLMTLRMIPRFKEMFISASLYGKDLCKKTSDKIPESLGVISGCIFLVGLFLFIPIPFSFKEQTTKSNEFPHSEFVELVAALLSICCMILLGFADDVLNLRWRHKLLLPTIATLPILMVYYVNFNSTTIIMPKFIRPLIGHSLNIGVLYYIYMGMLAVFCTNAINILAGINGLEVGQSIVISISILIFNIIEILNNNQISGHLFSIYLITPFLTTSLALWNYNKYPAEIFVGDTFCYFAGMTFAVVGILGHFSKTLLLFFIPQIANFLYSVPQLFHLVPCPRHRLPKYNSETDLLDISSTIFVKNGLGVLGRTCVFLFRYFKLIKWQENKDGTITTNNFTLINFVLHVFGPVHEKILTRMLLGLQVVCTLIAFTIRYPMAKYFYDT
ncbi:UDP-N-acetylglucosamine--dolichyl-phosphate N-acetylglucosaminephosphotransferase [Condylostylus longicornis]|uniref:UDP-N-acetylglucosamine--dolichyl-phosphate N-acetylglucosaminephosphotransferase n=1 Tax=Condylostylus longicornis TaxID=2530218 RepID=UPI00244DE241|nr:UDP-N-acetylglucosamine--dolichyl-phosphate N-acetylglucosaminephosphotransferase [Condylostylus longicornis]